MIHAFKQIRLNGTTVVVTGGQLAVGNDFALLQSQTGQFYPLSNPSGFATNAYSASNPSGFITNSGFALNTNLIQTGVNLGNTISTQISNLSGFLTSNYLLTTKQQSFTTSIASGNDTYTINFPTGFSSIPKVFTSVNIVGNIMYDAVVTNKSTTNYTVLFSDIVAETGVSIDTFATI